VAPHRFIIACGDANDYLTRLRWSIWGPTVAIGRGEEWVNNCVPNCASGRFFHRHVQVLLWRIRRLHRHVHGLFRFTRLTVGHQTHIV